jgi:DNA polymerase-3 subunit gamma/tau
MAYVALYRKWRPKDFSDLIGQDHISRTLSNAITTGKIGHAYLFSGPRGTGKTSTAKIFAKALNCENGPTPEPCNICANCQKINEGSSMDVFEIDAASNRGIDEIRDLRETVKFAPADGRYKVYIIDEVHMLTAEAFNALLKTLEEPPAHVVFILATTEAHKVPATIQSRCQRYDFKRITVDEIQKRLALVASESNLAAEPEALRIIAIHADGGMRDALSILDQCSALAEDGVKAEKVRHILGLVGHEWIWKLTEALAGKNGGAILSLLDTLLASGKDVKQILAEMTLHMRSIMIYKAAGMVAGIELYNDQEDVLKQHAENFSHEEIVEIIQKLHAAMNEIKWSPQPRIAIEVALLSLCHPEAIASDGQNTSVSDERIVQLEAKVNRLTAALKKIAAMPGQTAGTPSSIKSNISSQQPKNNMVQASQQKMQGESQAAVEQATMPSTMAGNAEAQSIWKKLLETLKKQGKMPVYACVKAGEVRGINDTQFFIAFKSSFMMARTEREDYRLLLEEILQDLSGRSLRIICNLEAAPKVQKPLPPVKKNTPKPAPVQEKVEVNYDALNVEERHTLETAVEIFGDNFVRKEDLK